MSGTVIPAAADWLSQCEQKLQQYGSEALLHCTPPTEQQASAIDRACVFDSKKDGKCTEQVLLLLECTPLSLAQPGCTWAAAVLISLSALVCFPFFQSKTGLSASSWACFINSR